MRWGMSSRRLMICWTLGCRSRVRLVTADLPAVGMVVMLVVAFDLQSDDRIMFSFSLGPETPLARPPAPPARSSGEGGCEFVRCVVGLDSTISTKVAMQHPARVGAIMGIMWVS